MNAVARTLHDLTHRLPATPEHSESANARRPRAARPSHASHHHGPHTRNHHVHHPNSPRILVAWQTRIARLVGADRS